jgi:D-aminopeptidase
MISSRFIAGCLLIMQAALLAQAPKQTEVRHRARELGIVVGHYPAGEWNAITDVPGVLVGQTTIIRGSGPLRVGEGPVRTGVTAVFPRKDIWSNGVFAATHILNGDGEMTGTHWIRDLETQWRSTPPPNIRNTNGTIYLSWRKPSTGR